MRSARASGRHSIRTVRVALRFNKRPHIGHYLIVRDTGARIIQRGLYLGVKPTVITGRLLLGFERFSVGLCNTVRMFSAHGGALRVNVHESNPYLIHCRCRADEGGEPDALRLGL